MAVLYRADGARFAIRSYRESITPKKASLLRKELFLLSQTHGHFARFMRQRDGRIESVFSRDSAYLLGETVWYYFGAPADLIYCEVLPGETEAILVVVRGGSVYLDARFSFEELQDELKALFQTQVAYDIYVAGNAPLTQTPDDDKFLINPEWIKSFERLESSVFEQLSTLPALQLLPFEQAIAELELETPLKKLLTAAGILVALLIVWHWLTPAPQQTEQAVSANPMEQYASAYNNPEPSSQLDELANQIIILQSLPGWLPVNIEYISAGAKVNVHTLGSPTALLLEWAEKNHARVDFSAQGATLLLPSKLARRTSVPPLMSLTKTLSTIIDRMMQIIPGKSVSISGTKNQAAYKATAITISFEKGSPIVLALIGKALQGLPVTFQSSAITINGGLLSGTIQLTVLGN